MGQEIFQETVVGSGSETAETVADVDLHLGGEVLASELVEMPPLLNFSFNNYMVEYFLADSSFVRLLLVAGDDHVFFTPVNAVEFFEVDVNARVTSVVHPWVSVNTDPDSGWLDGERLGISFETSPRASVERSVDALGITRYSHNVSLATETRFLRGSYFSSDRIRLMHQLATEANQITAPPPDTSYLLHPSRVYQIHDVKEEGFETINDQEKSLDVQQVTNSRGGVFEGAYSDNVQHPSRV
ncbi:MAG: hypothetical protein R8G34_06525 [Paracoccaceae bacterium]|nr:hypothetical protein [Paracoccaceae bacterium]